MRLDLALALSLSLSPTPLLAFLYLKVTIYHKYSSLTFTASAAYQLSS